MPLTGVPEIVYTSIPLELPGTNRHYPARSEKPEQLQGRGTVGEVGDGLVRSVDWQFGGHTIKGITWAVSIAGVCDPMHMGCPSIGPDVLLPGRLGLAVQEFPARLRASF